MIKKIISLKNTSDIDYFKEKLPPDLIRYIFSFLPVKSVVLSRRWSSYFRQFTTNTPAVWRQVFMQCALSVHLQLSQRPSFELFMTTAKTFGWDTYYRMLPPTWLVTGKKELEPLLHWLRSEENRTDAICPFLTSRLAPPLSNAPYHNAEAFSEIIVTAYNKNPKSPTLIITLREAELVFGDINEWINSHTSLPLMTMVSLMAAMTGTPYCNDAAILLVTKIMLSSHYKTSLPEEVKHSLFLPLAKAFQDQPDGLLQENIKQLVRRLAALSSAIPLIKFLGKLDKSHEILGKKQFPILVGILSGLELTKDFRSITMQHADIIYYIFKFVRNCLRDKAPDNEKNMEPEFAITDINPSEGTVMASQLAPIPNLLTTVMTVLFRSEDVGAREEAQFLLEAIRSSSHKDRFIDASNPELFKICFTIIKESTLLKVTPNTICAETDKNETVAQETAKAIDVLDTFIQFDIVSLFKALKRQGDYNILAEKIIKITDILRYLRKIEVMDGGSRENAAIPEKDIFYYNTITTPDGDIIGVLYGISRLISSGEAGPAPYKRTKAAGGKRPWDNSSIESISSSKRLKNSASGEKDNRLPR